MFTFQVIIEDGLPKAVCIPCFKTIRIAYNFIRQFKESNTKLLENRENHILLCEIKCKQEESVQEYNSESGEEIIIEYKEDFDNTVISETANVRLIDGNCENEGIKIFTGDSSMEEEEELCIKYSDDNFDDDEMEEESKKKYRDIPGNKRQNRSNFHLKRKDVQNFTCPICGQSFLKFEVGFVKHLLTHKDVKLKCNKCPLETTLSMDLYVQHFRKAHRFQCDICSKSYGRRSGLYYHIKTHDDRKIYKCSYKGCTKSFLTGWCLRKHLHTHSESSKYVCNQCGSEFKTYGTFKYHQTTHDGNRSYLCTECGQTFLQSIHLKYHMWKHTGIKMFQCDQCHKSYTSQTQLKKHKMKKTCETIPFIIKKSHICE